MFGRSLDESFAPEIKRNVSAVVIARLVANACYRFAPPFLAIIAKSFDVSLSQIGVAIFVSELTGFASPFLGRVVDRLSHRNAMVLGLLGTGIGCTIAAAAPNVVVFAIGVTFLGLTKQAFENQLLSLKNPPIPKERLLEILRRGGLNKSLKIFE